MIKLRFEKTTNLPNMAMFSQPSTGNGMTSGSSTGKIGKMNSNNFNSTIGVVGGGYS